MPFWSSLYFEWLFEVMKEMCMDMQDSQVIYKMGDGFTEGNLNQAFAYQWTSLIPVSGKMRDYRF